MLKMTRTIVVGTNTSVLRYFILELEVALQDG